MLAGIIHALHFPSILCLPRSQLNIQGIYPPTGTAVTGRNTDVGVWGFWNVLQSRLWEAPMYRYMSALKDICHSYCKCFNIPREHQVQHLLASHSFISPEVHARRSIALACSQVAIFGPFRLQLP